MNLIFTCGGTAGHINPAIAVANQIRETRAIRSCNPSTPSVPGGCSGWGSASPGRNICICLSNITTIFSPSAARSWASSGPWPLSHCSA